MIVSCLFCNIPEPNYKPATDVNYICGGCVILLADASQDDLKKAYQKALDEGYQRKVSALESFIVEEKDEQIRPKAGKFSNRKRNARVFRAEKRTTRKPAKK